MMELTFRLYTRERAGYYDLSGAAGKITHTTNRAGSPGKLEMELLKTPALSFFEGDMVTLHVGNLPVFKGYVFKKSKNEKGEINVICYDQLRYLKANQSYVIAGMTAADVLRMIARDFRLETGEIADTGYVLPAYTEEDKGLFDILTNALDKTQIATGEMYVLFDDFGRLTLKSVRGMALPYILGEKSLLSSYEYTTSIDDETYNYIKLVRPNEQTGRADAYVYNDEAAIGRWGMLQLYKQVDKNMNEAQIRELGLQMLSYHNRVWDTLTCECAGILGLIAGNTIAYDVPDMGVLRRLVVDKCTHTFDNGAHTMSLELMTGGVTWS